MKMQFLEIRTEFDKVLFYSPPINNSKQKLTSPSSSLLILISTIQSMVILDLISVDRQRVSASQECNGYLAHENRIRL
jgi:hypothetical protein